MEGQTQNQIDPRGPWPSASGLGGKHRAPARLLTARSGQSSKSARMDIPHLSGSQCFLIPWDTFLPYTQLQAFQILACTRGTKLVFWVQMESKGANSSLLAKLRLTQPWSPLPRCPPGACKKNCCSVGAFFACISRKPLFLRCSRACS